MQPSAAATKAVSKVLLSLQPPGFSHVAVSFPRLPANRKQPHWLGSSDLLQVECYRLLVRTGRLGSRIPVPSSSMEDITCYLFRGAERIHGGLAATVKANGKGIDRKSVV